MFTKDAIDQISQAAQIRAANEAVAEAFDRHDTQVALPQGFALHDLERFARTRRHQRGSMRTISLQAFQHYISLHAEEGTAVFVDAKAMTATAVLNLGNPQEPGHADHVAQYVAQPTAAFTALQAVAGGRALTQQALAEWMEDWADIITCGRGDTDAIPTKQAIAAVRKITIEEQRKLETERSDLGASQSTFERIQASSADNPLPSWLDGNTVAYADLAPRTFRLRLAVLTDGKAPQLTLRVQKAEQHTQDLAQELTSLVSTTLDDMVPAMVGTFTAGN